jgi:short-subunit dehydrogenase
MAAELLIEQGHKVVLHARSAVRADKTRKKVSGAEEIVIGDLSSVAETKSVADQVNGSASSTPSSTMPGSVTASLNL